MRAQAFETRSERLRSRAVNYKSPAGRRCIFALELHALADEYDDEAALMDENVKINSKPPSPSHSESA